MIEQLRLSVQAGMAGQSLNYVSLCQIVHLVQRFSQARACFVDLSVHLSFMSADKTDRRGLREGAVIECGSHVTCNSHLAQVVDLSE